MIPAVDAVAAGDDVVAVGVVGAVVVAVVVVEGVGLSVAVVGAVV